MDGDSRTAPKVRKAKPVEAATHRVTITCLSPDRKFPSFMAEKMLNQRLSMLRSGILGRVIETPPISRFSNFSAVGDGSTSCALRRRVY